MKKYFVTFDESNKDYLNNSDAFAHNISIVEAEDEDDVHRAVYEKIWKSDRRHIRVKQFKIKKIEELNH